MKKRSVIITCVLLLIWFFIDMTGLYFGNEYLVTQSYKEDGIFFIIYLIAFILFISKEKIGKYFLDVWLLMWFITQFLSHWYFTITGGALSKLEYFKGSMKLIDSSTRYFPDLYHIVLHVLILITLIFVNIYIFKVKSNKNK